MVRSGLGYPAGAKNENRVATLCGGWPRIDDPFSLDCRVYDETGAATRLAYPLGSLRARNINSRELLRARLCDVSAVVDLD